MNRRRTPKRPAGRTDGDKHADGNRRERVVASVEELRAEPGQTTFGDVLAGREGESAQLFAGAWLKNSLDVARLRIQEREQALAHHSGGAVRGAQKMTQRLDRLTALRELAAAAELSLASWPTLRRDERREWVVRLRDLLYQRGLGVGERQLRRDLLELARACS